MYFFISLVFYINVYTMHIQLRHMIFEWDIEKNAKLQRERGVCFEDVERICKE